LACWNPGASAFRFLFWMAWPTAPKSPATSCDGVSTSATARTGSAITAWAISTRLASCCPLLISWPPGD
jgi:hypothetical protein